MWPIFLIIGLFFFVLFSALGNVLKKANSNHFGSGIPKNETKALNQLMRIIAFLMKANKIAKKCELEEVKIFLKQRFQEKEANAALQQLRIYLNSYISEYQIYDSCEILNYSLNYESKVQIVQLLFKIAASDEKIDANEIKIINYIANSFNISQYDYEAIIRDFNNYFNFNHNYNSNYDYGQDHNNYSYSYSKKNKSFDNYKILGVTPNSSEKEIKQAFRQKAKIFHPDKFANKSEAEKQNAKEKFQKINNAYEAICKEKNIK